MTATSRLHYRFLFLWIISLVAFGPTISQATQLSLQDDRYAHVLLIPFIAFILIYIRRKEIFCTVHPCRTTGTILLLFALGFYCSVELMGNWLNQSVRVMLLVVTLVIAWIATFLLCYGGESFRRARFALLFLFLMIPLPAVVLDNAAVALQHGSAEVSYVLFKLLGVPVFADGVKFSLPGVNIEIAEQCSGIRSCISLLITSVLAGYVFLRSGYSRLCLVVLTIPIAILKNAIRITTISWLGIHVNQEFFFGALHRHGGLPFSLVALAMMLPLVWGFRAWESRIGRRQLTVGSPVSSSTAVAGCSS